MYLLGLLNVIAPISEVHVSTVVVTIAIISTYSVHVNFVWNLLVASGVCRRRLNVCFQHIRLQCYSVPLQLKCIHLQRQKCSSPAQNSFVASDKHVHLQCDSYLEVCSKNYLVTSNECICLQCEIIFGGE